MADVYAIFGTLLALGIAFPGMLVALWLLFPRQTQRAEDRITDSAGKSLAMGLLTAVVIAIPVTILLALPIGLSKFLGGVLLLSSLSFAALGAAGVAGAMGRVLQSQSSNGMSQSAAFLRGAVALELAAAFPFIGWFLLLPVLILMSLGASARAVLSSRGTTTAMAEVDLVGDLSHEPQSA